MFMSLAKHIFYFILFILFSLKKEICVFSRPVFDLLAYVSIYFFSTRAEVNKIMLLLISDFIF